MAGTKLSALTAVTTLADDDLFVAVDVSNTTMAASGTTSGITAEDVAAYVTERAFGLYVPAPSGGDDTAVIQAAMTAAAGREVHLSAGTYLTSSDLVPAANSTISGAPDGTTTIRLTGTNRGFQWTNVPGVTLRDLTIDCDKANTADRGDTTQHGVHILANNSTGCPRTRLERVTIIDAWDRGFNAQATTVTTHPLEVELIDCEISGCGNQGAFISNSTRTKVRGGSYSQNGTFGLQVAGGRNARISNVDAYDNTSSGIVANTALEDFSIRGCHTGGNGSTNNWGIVVGINARIFTIADNVSDGDAGGITIDVADTVTNPIDTRGTLTNNVTINATIADGLHVNQADGLVINGHVSAYNEQDGVSIYGRNCIIDNVHSHHNGRIGIGFEEDLTAPLVSTGGHVYGAGNRVHDNNQNAGTWTDVYVGNLTYGGVLDVARARPLPTNMVATHFVQINPSPMTTSVLNDGQSYSLPFDIAEPCDFDQLLFEVVTTAGGTGSVCRGAIFYDDGTWMRPGRLREALGTVATTTTGVKTFTITNTTFQVGRYWVDIVPQGTPTPNPTIRVVTSPHIRVATPGLASLAQEFLMTTGITGAFADPHATVNSNNTVSIAMALRAA